MTVNDTPMSRGQKVHTPDARSNRSLLARTALLAGGATTGLVASALAGFGLVGLMFPNSGLPGTGGAPLTAAAYLPVEVEVMPETQVARVDPAPLAPARIAPAPDAPTALAVPTALAAPGVDAVADAPVTAAVPAASDPAQATAADPAATIVATKSAPSPVPAHPGPDTSSFGPRIAMLPPETAAGADTEPDAEPEVFAMLADDDAAARSGAGLFAESGRALDSETPADAAPLRPAARPVEDDAAGETGQTGEDGEEQLAAAAPAEISAAPTRSIRPAPRPGVPDMQLAAAPAAPAEIAAPTNVVEVAAHQGAGGFLTGGKSACGRALARAMPSRKGGATGSAFFAGLTQVSGPERDAVAIAELARGNMPSFLRNLQPVTFRGQDARGAETEITICVTPDYLALGSDNDFVRVPLGLPAAARIAGAFDMTLPTPRMVDAIYSQAQVRLSPAPMTPGAQMSTTNYFVTHNATIQGQLQGRRGLVAGHKKDVVMASRMASAPGRVAIYGWHQSSGAPIQPVSTVHGANYADYSHGIRLVSKTAYLNGRAVSLDELLESGRYAYLLNTDGPMPGPVIRTASN